ncbi:hypothetical protein Q3G72_012164 [Acer saccharum]|nr:hypothetical protein Q3G72_012164 [Acer saccharum]
MQFLALVFDTWIENWRIGVKLASRLVAMRAIERTKQDVKEQMQAIIYEKVEVVKEAIERTKQDVKEQMQAIIYEKVEAVEEVS